MSQINEDLPEDRMENFRNKPLPAVAGGVFMPGMSTESYSDGENLDNSGTMEEEALGTDEERI